MLKEEEILRELKIINKFNFLMLEELKKINKQLEKKP